MEIRNVEIDFDREILKINNKQITDRPVIVELPGPEGWELKKVYNPELATGNSKECDIIKITYVEGINSKLS